VGLHRGAFDYGVQELSLSGSAPIFRHEPGKSNLNLINNLPNHLLGYDFDYCSRYLIYYIKKKLIGLNIFLIVIA